MSAVSHLNEVVPLWEIALKLPDLARVYADPVDDARARPETGGDACARGSRMAENMAGYQAVQRASAGKRITAPKPHVSSLHPTEHKFVNLIRFPHRNGSVILTRSHTRALRRALKKY